MKCKHCGKRGLGNIQAVRAHLRFCPSRPGHQEKQPRSPQEQPIGRDPETFLFKLTDPAPTPANRKRNRATGPLAEQVPLAENYPLVKEFYEAITAIGIPDRNARIVSNTLGLMDVFGDADRLWAELKECAYLLSERERAMIFRYWLAVAFNEYLPYCTEDGEPFQLV